MPPISEPWSPHQSQGLDSLSNKEVIIALSKDADNGVVGAEARVWND